MADSCVICLNLQQTKKRHLTSLEATEVASACIVTQVVVFGAARTVGSLCQHHKGMVESMGVAQKVGRPKLN